MYTEMSLCDHKLNANFVPTLKEVYKGLSQELQKGNPRTPALIEQNGLRFLSVWIGLQHQHCYDPQQLRRLIGDLLGLQTYQMIQIVGDCNHSFSLIGREKAKNIIQPLLQYKHNSNKQVVLEYGYTSHPHDVNWIVDDLIAKTPGLGARTIANLVHDSAVAVEKWGMDATADVSNFVLAYDEKETAFGSDIWVSDSVMSATYGDRLICLEGGAQAFTQAVNACLKGLSVTAVTGPHMRELPSNDETIFFSAAHMLKFFNSIEAFDLMNSETVHERQKDLRISVFQYLNSVPELQGCRDNRKYNTIRKALLALLDHPRCWKAIEVVYV